jgi:hypothetical protein
MVVAVKVSETHFYNEHTAGITVEANRKNDVAR